MKSNNYIFTYILMAMAQVLLCNYLHISHYVMLSILPVIVLALPIRINTTAAMIIAFATGLSVDFLAEGMIGLNALSLVPVAYVRKGVCKALFGEEMIIRNEDFSVRKYGIPKVATAIAIVQSLFLFIYIWADGAMARPFSFSLLRFICSDVAGIITSLLIIGLLTTDDRR